MSWGLMALADMFFKDVSFFDGSPNVDLSSNHRNWKILIENMYNVRRCAALFTYIIDIIKDITLISDY